MEIRRDIIQARKNMISSYEKCHKTIEKNILDVIRKFDHKGSGSIMLSRPVAINMVLDSEIGYITNTIRLFDEIRWSDNKSIDYFMLRCNQDDDLIISSAALTPVRCHSCSFGWILSER